MTSMGSKSEIQGESLYGASQIKKKIRLTGLLSLNHIPSNGACNGYLKFIDIF